MVLDIADNIVLSPKTLDGKVGIDSDNISWFVRQNICILMQINELNHHLIHVIQMLCVIFEDDSFLIKQLTEYQKHIQSNYTTYSKILRLDSM